MNHPPYHHQAVENELLSTITSSFFYDEKTVLSFDAQTREQAKGHLVLLGSNVESFLKLATLIDGSSVDFLFGVRYGNSAITGIGRSKANEVKKFIRSLDPSSQESLAEFYFTVYSAIVDYYEAQQSCCSFLCRERNKSQLFERIERAFSLFERRVKSQSKQ